MGTINDRKSKNLTEGKKKKKKKLRRGSKNIQKNCTKKSYQVDNHNGVVTYLAPVMLECEVKWTLGSIVATKVVKVMVFQLSYFKS